MCRIKKRGCKLLKQSICIFFLFNITELLEPTMSVFSTVFHASLLPSVKACIRYSVSFLFLILLIIFIQAGKGRTAGAVTVTGAAAGGFSFFRSCNINDYCQDSKQYRYYDNICNVHILTSCSPLVYAGIQVLSNQKNILPI